MTHTATAPDLTAWRHDQFRSLLRFGQASLRADGGAQWLDDDGRPDVAQPVHTWITSRMAHCFAVGDILGVQGAGEACDLALRGLREALADPEFGGWFASIGSGPAADAVAEGRYDGTKAAYAHAFVVLAASSATIAGRPRAADLLDEALETLDRRFWEPAPRLHADEAVRDWSRLDPYRGVNANMHGVEALLAAHDATGNEEWLKRAESIVDQVIAWAKECQWRIPEHFDADWTPLLEFNADRPRDQFKPYGSTPGHGLEWARLIVQTDVARRLRQDAGAGAHRLGSAEQLFDQAVRDGWDPVRGGFAYTVDWTGVPVEPRRFHWVAAEAVAAAGVLGREAADPVDRRRYEELDAGWWQYIRRFLVDTERGSWYHELDTENRPSPVTWVGKPDIYHAAQAVILPDLPLAGSIAGAARAAGPLLG
jgi:mannose/cellobiose epimerase-like protein (N-acyl-D-glucosamine 2-epimerase family)